MENKAKNNDMIMMFIGLWKPPLDKPTTSLCQMTANPDGTYTLKIKPEIAGKLTVAFHDRHVPGKNALGLLAMYFCLPFQFIRVYV